MHEVRTYVIRGMIQTNYDYDNNCYDDPGEQDSFLFRSDVSFTHILSTKLWLRFT